MQGAREGLLPEAHKRGSGGRDRTYEIWECVAHRGRLCSNHSSPHCSLKNIKRTSALGSMMPWPTAPAWPHADRVHPARHEGKPSLVVGARHTVGRHQGLHIGNISVGARLLGSPVVVGVCDAGPSIDWQDRRRSLELCVMQRWGADEELCMKWKRALWMARLRERNGSCRSEPRRSSLQPMRLTRKYDRNSRGQEKGRDLAEKRRLLWPYEGDSVSGGWRYKVLWQKGEWEGPIGGA
jgi:hypothetical protein